jgi:multidrug efflux pump subunit AcrA (membrane-fusion protein)
MGVKKGQVLFSIDQSTFKARVEAAQAALTSAKAALDNLVAPTRKERLDALQAAVAELDARVKDREREEARYHQLVQVDRVQPAQRLEEVQLELEQARNQLKAAQARLDEALAGPTRTEIAIADARVKEAQAMLESAQLDLRDTVVVAPFDGVITRRMKGLGDYVAGAPFIEVLELTTLEHLEADLRLPEAYLPQVVGGKTRLTLHSPLMKANQELVVTRVIPDIDPERGTFAVRVAIPAEQRSGLVPGAFVTATLSLDGRDAAVVVPQRAVISNSGKNYVMVADGGTMHLRAVEVGDRLTEGIILKSGLRPGEQVIVGPPEQLKDGAPLADYLLEKNE